MADGCRHREANDTLVPTADGAKTNAGRDVFCLWSRGARSRKRQVPETSQPNHSHGPMSRVLRSHSCHHPRLYVHQWTESFTTTTSLYKRNFFQQSARREEMCQTAARAAAFKYGFAIGKSAKNRCSVASCPPPNTSPCRKYPPNCTIRAYMRRDN